MVFIGKRGLIRRGMSLLEVVLALGILLMSLAALAQLISAGSRAAIDSKLRTEAIIRCQSKMAEVVSGGEPLQSVEGATCEDDPRWQWTLEIQTSPIENLLEVRVTVFRGRSSQAATVECSLNRYLRDPNAFVLQRIQEQEARSRQQTVIKPIRQSPNDRSGEDADR